MRSPDRGSGKACYSLRHSKSGKTGGFHEYVKGENRRSPPAWVWWIVISMLVVLTIGATLTVCKNKNVTEDATNWVKYQLDYEVVIATSKETQ